MSSWHLRTPDIEHLQRFHHLVDLHRISLKWSDHFKIPLNSESPSLQNIPSLKEDLWMLDAFPHPELNDYLSDLSIDEVLLRFEKLIWITQAWLIQHLLKSASHQEELILSVLEQESWRAGKECSLHQWKTLILRRKQLTLSEVALAFYSTPCSGYPHSEPFLVERCTAQSASLKRMSCPHHSPWPEVQRLADELCSLHTHWMRGFAFSLNPSLQIELPDPNKPCIQRWHLHETHESGQ